MEDAEMKDAEIKKSEMKNTSENREDMYQKIAKMAESEREELTKIRRDFHRYPETGWLEMRTSAKIAEYLKSLGLEVLTGKSVCREGARMAVPDGETLREHFEKVKSQGAPEEFLTEEMGQGYTGVVGILRCGEGPVTALRFDIDALPMTRPPTRSTARTGKAFLLSTMG